MLAEDVPHEAEKVIEGPPLERPFLYGAVAQLGEQRLCKPKVEGSSPFSSTSLKIRGHSSSGRALLSHGRGGGFKSLWLHNVLV